MNTARKSRGGPVTVPIRSMTKEKMSIETLLYPESVRGRPATRGECCGGARPCPFVGCLYHLYLDVNAETGSMKMNFPGVEPWEIKDSCALDVADRGGVTLEEVGDAMNLTRERIRQVETQGLQSFEERISKDEIAREAIRP